MKVLFTGDIHNKLYVLDKIEKLDKKYNFDKILFMGDYIDNWDSDNHTSLKVLDKVFNLKKENMNKYVLLIGNHERSYLGYPCSGHIDYLEDAVTSKLTENIDLLDFYFQIKIKNEDFICTHAGLTNEYIDEYLGGKDKYKKTLNDWNKNKLKNLHNLNVTSFYRGGRGRVGSFVWADKKELFNEFFSKEQYYAPYQIIGHTPQKTITHYKNEYYGNSNGEFYFIDTHSTYNDGTMYGDGSFLIFLDDKEVIEKCS